MFTFDNDVNIVGVRIGTGNEFDDEMHVLLRYGPEWKEHVWPITCDPGKTHLDHPMNKDGCARLRAGQYLKAYKMGLHRNQYRALVQCRPVKVDRIKDGEVVAQAEGVFGINIHKAGKDSEFVNRWSAGCQVFKREADFNEFLDIVQQSMNQYGPHVSYTLVEN